jgi:hypothetical protein
MLAFLEKLFVTIIVKVALAYLDSRGDEDFKAKSLPAREKLRSATTAKEARDASMEIHKLLSGV